MKTVCVVALGLLLASPALGKKAWEKKAISEAAGARQLAVVGDTLLVNTWNGHVAALDARNGEQRWREKSPKPGDVDGTQLAVAGGTVVVAWPGGNALTGYAPSDGETIWKRPLGAPHTSLAACSGHRLVAATHRGQDAAGKTTLLLHAVDPKDGRTLWKVPTEGDLVGAGGGFLFTAKEAGVGAWKGQLFAHACATGAATPVPVMERRFVTFVDAEAGKVAALYHDLGRRQGQLCVQTLADGASTCLDPAKHDGKAYPVSTGLLRGDTLYFSTAHVEAHNLNKAPDSWLFAYDLKKGALIGKGEPLTASSGIVDAANQLLTGFGSTGADDFAYLVEPATLKRLSAQPLDSAPSAMAVDAKRAYVATYKGAVVAIELPAPGPSPAPEKTVAAQGEAAPVAPPSLGWQIERVIADAHPKKAKTSGQNTEGTVAAVAFVGGDGKRIVTGGNDDRVRVFEVASGKETWKSKPLGKDVQNLASCSDPYFVARTYGGDLTLFTRNGRRFRAKKTIEPGHGWAFGLDDTCSTILVDDFEGAFTFYSAKTGDPITAIQGERATWDRRGVRVIGPGVAVPAPGGVALYDLSNAKKGPKLMGTKTVADQAHDGRLVQAHALDPDTTLAEYCGADGCAVVVQKSGQPERVLRFDTKGAAWSPSVPSLVRTSPDGRFITFYRDGLDLQVVEVATDVRQVLGAIPRTMASTPDVAFSPDGRRLAVTMKPKPWSVTLYTYAPPTQP